MAENYLITGYWGEPHVTAENDRGINAAIFGAGRFVLPVGEQLRAEYIGNNTVRIHDGKLVDNGAVAGIPAGEYVDLIIREAGQGMKRNDLIVFQYSKNDSTLVESGVFMVLSGDETSGTATDPVLSQQDILTNTATFDQMALWRVPVSGAVISAPVQLFSVLKTVQTLDEHVHPEQVSTHGITTGGNDIAYTATVPGITSLTAGACFIMIPHKDSTSATPTLNVNGLGAKTIRQRLSTNNAITVPFKETSAFSAGKPVLVMYNGTYWVAEITRPDASNLYGTTPITSGGTGGTTAETARANLGITPANIGAFPSAPKYYSPNEGGKNADDLLDPFALIPISDTSNAELQKILGGGFAYVVTLFSGVNAERRVQIAFAYNSGCDAIAMRSYSTNGWFHWKAVGYAPLSMGVEIPTGEIYRNKPVYTMLFNGGAISDGAEIDYPNIAADTISVIDSRCTVDKIQIPQRANGTWGTADAKSTNFACYLVNQNSILINCGTGVTGKTIYVQIWYTKD